MALFVIRRLFLSPACQSRRQKRREFNAWVWKIPCFPSSTVVKNRLAEAGDPGDVGSVPEGGRSPGEGNGHPLQCSCWENPMDRGAWRPKVHEVTKSWTRLSN